MDVLSLIGIIMAFVAIIGGNYLEGGHLGALANGPAALIVLGGTGFAVLGEVTRQRFQWRELSLHSRLVLGMTGVLLLMGMTFFCLTEWHNPATLGGISGAGNKLVNALMQSTTMRTAGFNSVDLASMRQSSKLMSIILMFIGASPASTGGGVKTTTVAVLALTVVSFPLLLDRDVGLYRAVITSVRAVAKNPGTMAAWGFIVACGLAIGSLPAFIGLIIVLPILGHATWHLYRKVVV